MKERDWRPYDREIAKVFNRFAGKTVNPADVNDPVLEDMRTEAAMHYSYLNLVPEGSKRGEDSDQIIRINAELVAGSDGKWHIGNRFFRG
jgi:hypothetical protein